MAVKKFNKNFAHVQRQFYADTIDYLSKDYNIDELIIF